MTNPDTMGVHDKRKIASNIEEESIIHLSRCNMGTNRMDLIEIIGKMDVLISIYWTSWTQKTPCLG